MASIEQQASFDVDLQPLARKPHVLLAEDDARMRTLLTSILERDGFEVSVAKDGGELLEWLEELLRRPGPGLPVDLILTDVKMPNLSGLEVLGRLRRQDWAIPVILITAFGDAELHADAARLGAVAVFDKPFDLDDLRTAALYYGGMGELR